ncbi:MAG: hypothetical protein KDD44_13085, partial [Bdellovibrionales bacterium]|nr:hypothetical protein [Bdellovibrionales bacterium]
MKHFSKNIVVAFLLLFAGTGCASDETIRRAAEAERAGRNVSVPADPKVEALSDREKHFIGTCVSVADSAVKDFETGGDVRSITDSEKIQILNARRRCCQANVRDVVEALYGSSDPGRAERFKKFCKLTEEDIKARLYNTTAKLDVA